MTNDTDRSRNAGPDDQLLDAAMEGEARRVQPRTDWDDVVRRASRRRFPVPLVAVAAALLALVAGGAAFLALADDAGVQEVITEPTTAVPAPTTTNAPDLAPPTTSPVEPGPTTTTPVEPAPTTTTSPSPPGSMAPALGLPAAAAPLAEDEYAAVVVRPGLDFDELELVVLSAITGEELRTLATGFDTVEGGIFGLTLTPDRRTVLFVRATSACTSDVLAVPVDGTAEPVVVAGSGDAVAASHGGTLAVATGDSCQSTRAVEVTRPRGEVTTYPLPGEVGAIESMAFGAEDELLYVAWDPSFATRTLHRLDLTSGRDEVQTPGPAGSRYESLRARPGGGATVLRTTDDGSAGLAVLVDGAIVDERSIQPAEPSSAFLDAAGRVAVVSAQDGTAVLHVDGERRAAGVIDVTG